MDILSKKQPLIKRQIGTGQIFQQTYTNTTTQQTKNVTSHPIHWRLSRDLPGRRPMLACIVLMLILLQQHQKHFSESVTARD
jgi:hypothetical protein